MSIVKAMALGLATVLMMKAPAPGRVKTRLCPPLTPEEAAGLALAMAGDVIAAARESGAVVIAYTPEGERGEIEAALGKLAEGAVWVAQRGNDLGERLGNALRAATRLGYGPVALVGTDHPTISAADIKEAAALASQTDVVFSPSDDGGYRLIAAARHHAGLFRNIRWSSEHTLGDSEAQAMLLGLRTSTVGGGYDIDTFADLVRLRAELAEKQTAARRAPRRTAEWIAAHPALFLP